MLRLLGRNALAYAIDTFFQTQHLSLLRLVTLVPVQLWIREIPNLVFNNWEIEPRVHAVIDKFAERGLRSLVYQVINWLLGKKLAAVWKWKPTCTHYRHW